MTQLNKVDKSKYSDLFQAYFQILVRKLHLNQFQIEMAKLDILVFEHGEASPLIAHPPYKTFYAYTDDKGRVIGGYFN